MAPATAQRLREGSLFTGYNGLGLATETALGTEPAWMCEYEPPTPKNPNPSQAAARILEHHYPHVPNLGDITAVDWSTVAPIDVLTAGFPCQDVSAAGRRAGLRPGTRSGLWSHVAYAISQLQPRLVIIENVRGLLSAEAHSDMERCPWCVGDGEGVPALRALGAVLGDLADLGYVGRWCGIRAADVGAPHGRYRVFVVAWPAPDTDDLGQQRSWRPWDGRPGPEDRGVSATDSDVERLARAEPSAPRRPGQTDHPERCDHVAADPYLDELAGERLQQPRRPAAAGSGPTPTHADSNGLQGVGRIRFVGRDADRRDGAREAAADTERGGWTGWPPEPIGQPIDRVAPARGGAGDIAWGPYEAAVRRWERVLGRVAPPPTEPGRDGAARLSPRFVEWMMGLPDGWVTGVPGISRNDQLKVLGNGVVPQQGAAAIRYLLGITP